MSKKKTLEDFILDATKIHRGKYAYSLVEYKNTHTKINIICPIHGSFWQTPNHHLKGYECQKCGIMKISEANSLTQQQFLEIASAKHSNKYDYSLAEYKNAHTKVEIICPIHGSFWQTPDHHTGKKSQGCKKCSDTEKGIKQRLTTEQFIEKASKAHNNFYCYDKTNYKTNGDKVEIICPIHGSFWQTPASHFGVPPKGCPQCGRIKINEQTKYTLEEFINEANIVHNNKYDYSLTNYQLITIKINIICPIHGSFWQTPSLHLSGRGCSKCNESKGERKIRIYLDKNSTEYIPQFRFKDSTIYNYRFDFFVNNMFAIEYHGEQHYRPFDFKTKKDSCDSKLLEKIIHRDLKKELWCKRNNIPLHVIPFWELNNVDNILDAIFNNQEYKISKAPKKVLDHEYIRQKIIKNYLKENYQ